MALPGEVLTLREWAIDKGKGNVPDDMIDMISKATPIMEDIPFKESNLDTGEKFRSLVALPSYQFRSINQGVTPSKSTRTEHIEEVTHVESVSEIDKKLVDMSVNGSLYRMEEAEAHLKSMTQGVAQNMWYGNKADDPRSLIGLSLRYGTLTGDVGEYVIDAGGTGNDLTSIWIVYWGRRSLYGIFPKGSQVGMSKYFSGMIDLTDTDNSDNRFGGTYQGYRDRFMWDYGLVVKDYRQAVRIANIDVNALATIGTDNDTAPDLLILLNQALNRIQDKKEGRGVIYMNRTVVSAFDVQLLTRGGSLSMTIDEATGKQVRGYTGLPFKIDDTLIDAEERVA